MIEEHAVVVEIDRDYAEVESKGASGCCGCGSASTCGTGLLASMFRPRPGHLRVLNTVGAKTGDVVVIGLDRMAMVIASLMTYLAPLLMLIVGAVVGEALGEAYLPQAGETLSIVSGLAFAAAAFIFNHRIMNTGVMQRLLQPRMLDRRG